VPDLLRMQTPHHEVQEPDAQTALSEAEPASTEPDPETDGGDVEGATRGPAR